VPHDRPGELTGSICPRCGGPLWKHTNGHAAGDAEQSSHQCHIGHRFTPADLWVQACQARNQAIGAAARAVAENVDLARALAEKARAIGNEALAARLDDEARREERYVGELLGMLEELGML
jgi:two-component system, chemotaxis family, protein-glutamate methylesterase/glutaminase